jgi:hypothetical protein
MIPDSLDDPREGSWSLAVFAAVIKSRHHESTDIGFEDRHALFWVYVCTYVMDDRCVCRMYPILTNNRFVSVLYSSSVSLS